MLTVGDTFPTFKLKAVSSPELPEQFDEIDQDSFRGKWKVFVFWPKDFTFVCPTEITGYGDLNTQFQERETQLLGASTDSDFVHLAWRRSRKDLATVPYPWLSDIRKELSAALGILQKQEGVPLRATFIVDPEGIIRHVSINDLDVGRNPLETLRVLDALQSGALTPCAWRPGEQTVQVA